jgi:hypothetical protein
MEEAPGTKGCSGEREAKCLGICPEVSGTLDIRGSLGLREASDIGSG